MDVRQFILDCYLRDSKEILQHTIPEHRSRHPMIIGPVSNQLNGLIEAYSTAGYDAARTNIRASILISHQAIAALNGQEKYDEGNLYIVNPTYRIPDCTHLTLFYNNKLCLVLDSAKDTTFFTHCVLFRFDDWSFTRTLEQLADTTKIMLT